MTRRTSSIDAAYFENLYTTDADPWGFQTSDYERAKYAATLAALTRQRYGRALEIGCSIGVLTRQLASRSDAVLAIDGSPRALETARVVCAGCPGVTFEARVVPSAFPDGQFDLILLSEVLYFMSADDLRRTADRCADALEPGGEIVACHWLGETDYPLSGQEASDLLIAHLGGRVAARTTLNDDTYRLERLTLV